jgi:MinD superfamily P-loop ATPase
VKLAIASGKGGTGKTTVAVNLARVIGPVQVLDCDVEDPDAALFLHPEISSVAPVTVNVPRVLPQRCTYCRACARFCEYHAIVVLADQWLITPELCKDCGGCYLACPEEALVPESRGIGVLERGASGTELNLVTGRMNPGEVMATPLIRRVKNEARGGGTVLIDCPPGSACSMVHAVEGADGCLMVTEPTPFGLHDLQQAVAVVKQMDIPIAVVINRSDLGQADVEGYCQQAGVPVLMKIPYDLELARAYADGRDAVSLGEAWRVRFESLWQGVQDYFSKTALPVSGE